MSPLIHFVVALPAEARPLVKHFGLQKQDVHQGFDIYRNDEMALVVSGVGKINASAAVAVLQANSGFPRNAVWLNCGIAGCQYRHPGEVFLVHKIIDAASRQSFFPIRLSQGQLNSENLLCVDLPASDYPEDMAVDMEASGFFATATRFSSAELVQCIKVVSDNSVSTLAEINAAWVSAWLQQAIMTIEQVIDATLPLSLELKAVEQEPEYFSDYLECWHFTASQKIQLNNLLRRWQVLANEADRSPQQWSAVPQARQLLQELHRVVSAAPIDFSASQDD